MIILTSITFYILQSGTHNQRLAFQSKLLEQLSSNQRRVCILTENHTTNQDLDAFLWQSPEAGFLPHTTPDDPAELQNIVLCHTHVANDHNDILVNLTHDIPAQFSRFQRVIEIVNQSDHILTTSRQRYKFYQSRGYHIDQHKLENY